MFICVRTYTICIYHCLLTKIRITINFVISIKPHRNFVNFLCMFASVYQCLFKFSKAFLYVFLPSIWI